MMLIRFIAATGSALLRLSFKLTGLLTVIFAFSPACADHSAPAPQLGGVRLGVAPSSVQLGLEGAAFSPASSRRVREAVWASLQETFTAREIPFEDSL